MHKTISAALLGALLSTTAAAQTPTGMMGPLRPDQTDQDSLPPYEVLDAILHGLVEEEATLDEIVARGHDPATVERVQRLLYTSEYKRRQAAPGVKIGARAFGRDRRYPLTNAFRTA